MPLATTHALIPLAAAIAFIRRRFPHRLVLAAMMASAAPDLDAFASPIWHLQSSSIYTHRGASHSLFVALTVSLFAAAFHKQLRVPPTVAAAVVGVAMASHGLLDMMTDYGLPVAYLWPVSSARYFANWRPIHSAELEWGHWATQLLPRFRSEMWQVVLPMFGFALAMRIGRKLLDRAVLGRA
jgi:inner membrane protein